MVQQKLQYKELITMISKWNDLYHNDAESTTRRVLFMTKQMRQSYFLIVYILVWRKANPNAKLTIDDMVNIEIQAMTNAGIPNDIATGWVIKALENLKIQGVTEIKNIPWNGIN